MKVAFVNLGCKVNHAELEDYATRLLSKGAELAPESEADVIIVNTCTVTAEAEKKTRKAVRHALGANEDACVVVTGCSVAIDPETYAAMSERVSVVEKWNMEAHVEALAAAQALKAGEITLVDPGETLFRTRSAIRIQDGCNNDCSYCIVHIARGKSRSFAREDILTAAREILARGLHEIVLTGINLGTFEDAQGGLASLVRDILALDAPDGGIFRVRLSSIEPSDIDEDLIALMAAAEGRVCRHLHVPLQSGSTKVLAEMNRHYTAEEFCALVDRMRAAMPELALSTDIIVGFPGETDADFAETCAVARKCGFNKIHVFPYSRREGTVAAARKDQVPPEVKKRRAAELRALSDELHGLDFARRMGTEELCCVEADGTAITESYHRVAVDADAVPGTLVRVTLTAEVAGEVE